MGGGGATAGVLNRGSPWRKHQQLHPAAVDQTPSRDRRAAQSACLFSPTADLWNRTPSCGLVRTLLVVPGRRALRCRNAACSLGDASLCRRRYASASRRRGFNRALGFRGDVQAQQRTVWVDSPVVVWRMRRGTELIQARQVPASFVGRRRIEVARGTRRHSWAPAAPTCSSSVTAIAIVISAKQQSTRHNRPASGMHPFVSTRSAWMARTTPEVITKSGRTAPDKCETRNVSERQISVAKVGL